MPRIISFRPAAACALVLFISAWAAVPALGKGFDAELRVVGKGGKVLAEKTVRTGKASLKASPAADCFGAGTGGSGKPLAIRPNTALGLLARAAQSTPTLRPLRITDAFDFGLGICGIGSSTAGGSASWYLKVNHKALAVGGDAATIRPGDEVLWALAVTEPPSFAYPDELALTAPRSVTAGKPFTVRVFAYDEKGRRRPQAGATVTGATGPTGADGRATVRLTKPRRLIARHADGIPSNRVAVCVGGKCPR